MLIRMNALKRFGAQRQKMQPRWEQGDRIKHKGEADHAPSPLRQVLAAVTKRDSRKRFGAQRH